MLSDQPISSTLGTAQGKVISSQYYFFLPLTLLSEDIAKENLFEYSRKKSRQTLKAKGSSGQRRFCIGQTNKKKLTIFFSFFHDIHCFHAESKQTDSIQWNGSKLIQSNGMEARQVFLNT